MNLCSLREAMTSNFVSVFSNDHDCACVEPGLHIRKTNRIGRKTAHTDVQ
jgi:hypothetical protein